MEERGENDQQQKEEKLERRSKYKKSFCRRPLLDG
jgi:hypothetical protein